VAVVAMGLVVLAGCQRDEQRPQALAVAAPVTQEVSPGTLVAGDKIAPPKGEVVLTVSGEIGAHNQGRKLALDLASLAKMRTVRMQASACRSTRPARSASSSRTAPASAATRTCGSGASPPCG
jgi:hypothetical protein